MFNNILCACTLLLQLQRGKRKWLIGPSQSVAGETQGVRWCQEAEARGSGRGNSVGENCPVASLFGDRELMGSPEKREPSPKIPGQSPNDGNRGARGVASSIHPPSPDRAALLFIYWPSRPAVPRVILKVSLTTTIVTITIRENLLDVSVKISSDNNT
ncbi:hypothetical protein KM043_012693 [Ampulex compressa]|nr:hypothetical protein KM043_012693 [Ampulex compressa]